MSQTSIYCAVIVIITCLQLQSVHLREYEREKGDMGSRQLRQADDNDLISLENLRRPILIEQKKIDSTLDGSKSCENVFNTITMKNAPSSYDGLSSLKCNGWIDGCVNFDSNKTPNGKYCVFGDELIWAKEEKPTGSVEYGVKGKCEEKSVSDIVESTDKAYHTCMCQCTPDTTDFELNVNWVISLQHSVSDVNSNKIVEGVRIRTSHKLIYLEIKERELGCSNGGIWKSVNTMNKLIRNEDYSALVPHDRTLQLNEIAMPPGYVVTGVRFAKVFPDVATKKGLLRLEAQGTKLDEKTGGLISSTSVWFDTEGVRAAETADGRITKPVDGGKNLKKNVEFRSRRNKQTNFELLMIPYLDLSDVTAENSMLTAVGLACRRCDTDEEYIVPTISAMQVAKPENTTSRIISAIPVVYYPIRQVVSAGAFNSLGFFVAFVSLVTIIIFYEI